MEASKIPEEFCVTVLFSFLTGNPALPRQISERTTSDGINFFWIYVIFSFLNRIYKPGRSNARISSCSARSYLWWHEASNLILGLYPFTLNCSYRSGDRHMVFEAFILGCYFDVMELGMAAHLKGEHVMGQCMQCNCLELSACNLHCTVMLIPHLCKSRDCSGSSSQARLTTPDHGSLNQLKASRTTNYCIIGVFLFLF